MAKSKSTRAARRKPTLALAAATGDSKRLSSDQIMTDLMLAKTILETTLQSLEGSKVWAAHIAGDTLVMRHGLELLDSLYDRIDEHGVQS